MSISQLNLIIVFLNDIVVNLHHIKVFISCLQSDRTTITTCLHMNKRGQLTF